MGEGERGEVKRRAVQNNQRNDCIFRGEKSGQMRFGRILGEREEVLRIRIASSYILTYSSNNCENGNVIKK